MDSRGREADCYVRCSAPPANKKDDRQVLEKTGEWNVTVLLQSSVINIVYWLMHIGAISLRKVGEF